MQTKCQGHSISRLLTWVLFYSVSLLFKQHRKSRKCNINFYMAFIFIPIELFKIQGISHAASTGGWHIILYVPSQSHICTCSPGGGSEVLGVCSVWSHCVFCGKWCDNGHSVGVDLTGAQEESVSIQPGCYPLEIHAHMQTHILRVCIKTISVDIHIDTCRLHPITTLHIFMCACTVYCTMQCICLQSVEREKKLMWRYFIKSLFWNFKKLYKTNFDRWELPNLGPNEIFSNVGSLIMKNGWRALILYR